MPKIVATKEDWIKLGYKLFSASGELGIVVDKMSRLLKCNKSSFYWHFKSKSNFIEHISEYWIQSETNDTIQQVDKLANAEQKLLKLTEIAFHKDSNLDFIFFLKRYAISHPKIQKKIDKIDKERMAYVAGLLVDIGYDTNTADLKASIFYKYLIGYHEMIRYKKQRKGYLSEVLMEIKEFVQIAK